MGRSAEWLGQGCLVAHSHTHDRRKMLGMAEATTLSQNHSG